MKRNNNNSEGVDGYQQWSSNAIEAPSRSGPNVIQLPRLENGTTHIWDTGPFHIILNVADTFQKCKNINRSSRWISCFLPSAITVFLLVCLITKCLIFLQVIRVFYIFVNEGSMTNAKVYQGPTMTKRLKSTALEPHLIISEVTNLFVTNYVQTCFQRIKFLRHV